MKLTQINYNKPVKKFRTIDAQAPMRAANAQAAVANVPVAPSTDYGRLAIGIAGVAAEIDDKYSVSEYQDGMAKYNATMAQELEGLTSSPYTEEPVDPDNPEGEKKLVSNHLTVNEKYADIESRVRNSILGGFSGSRSAQMFNKHADKVNAKNTIGVRSVGLGWKSEEIHTKSIGAINSYVSSQDYEGARSTYRQGMASGVFSKSEAVKIPAHINNREEFHGAASAIEAAASTEDYNALRANIESDEFAPSLSITDRNQLDKMLDKKITETMLSGLQTQMSTTGVASGIASVYDLVSKPLSETGFGTEKSRNSAIGQLQGMVNNFTVKSTANAKQSAIDGITNSILKGGSVNVTTSNGKAGYNAAFAQLNTDQEGSQFKTYSPEYNRNVLELTEQVGLLPPDVLSSLKMDLLHSDPSNVVGASNLLQDLRVSSPAAYRSLSGDELMFGKLVSERVAANQPPEEAIKAVRDILNVDDSVKKNRNAEFNSVHLENADDVLLEMIDNDNVADPYFSWQAEMPKEMGYTFSKYYREEYLRSGDQSASAKRAYELTRGEWGVSDRNGGVELSHRNPEAMLNGGEPAEWITEETNHMLNSLGIDGDSVDLVYNGAKGGTHSWALRKRDTNLFFDDDQAGSLVEHPDGGIAWLTFDKATSQHQMRTDAEASAANQASERDRLLRLKIEQADVIDGKIDLDEIEGDKLEIVKTHSKMLASKLVGKPASDMVNWARKTFGDVMNGVTGESVEEIATKIDRKYTSDADLLKPNPIVADPSARGIKSNNPVNLRKTDSQWQGKIDSADGFEAFDTPLSGIRAGAVNAMTQFNRGLNTINKLITSHAPPSENPTKAYVKFVSDYLNIAANEVIDLTDKNTMFMYIKAIIAFENSGYTYPEDLLQRGVLSAGN